MTAVHRFIRQNLGKWGIAVGAGLVSGIGGAGLVATINLALNGPATAVHSYFSGFLLCAGSLVLGGTVSHMILARLSQDASLALRLQLSLRILSLPFRSIERIGASRLLAALTEDVHSVSAAMTLFPSLLTNAAIILGCLVYLAWLSWLFLFVLIGVLLLAMIGSRIILRIGHRNFRRARDKQDWLLSHFRTLTAGAKELKLNKASRDAFLREDIEQTAGAIHQYAVTGSMAYAFAQAWFQAVLLMLLGIVFFCASDAWFNQEVFAGYVLAFLFMIGPITQAMSAMDTLAQGGIALRKIRDLGVIDAAMNVADIPERSASGETTLELRGLVFHYQPNEWGEQFNVGPLSASLRGGRLLFIVGGNGSGKSTLVKVLCGLYSPSAGELLLNQSPVTDANREWYQMHVACVFSDFHVWHRLVIADGAGMEMRQLVERLGLPSSILETSFWYPQLPLSEWQRRRVALLGALAADKPIYIFDEWAADQDSHFKDYFYLNLLPALKRRGKLVIVVTHDEQYFSVADETLKLHGRRSTVSCADRDPALTYVSAYGLSDLGRSPAAAVGDNHD
jgi:putative ATP-binding cassette transporter